MGIVLDPIVGNLLSLSAALALLLIARRLLLTDEQRRRIAERRERRDRLRAHRESRRSGVTTRPRG